MAKQPAKKSTPVVENKTAINRAKRLARHLKQHPNDTQAQKAAKGTKAPRKAPKAKGVHPQPKYKLRDASGKIVGLANFSTFSFANNILVLNEKGNLTENPEIRVEWNKYKSALANAATKGRRKHV